MFNQKSSIGFDLLNANSVLASSVPELHLGEDLVGEGAGHDEGGMASGTAEVDETTFSQKDEVTAVGHQVAVNLGLDVDDLLGVGLQPGDINFNVKVTDAVSLNVISKGREIVKW